MKYKVLDLFSGIGGFSLGLERTGGFETVAFCEIEEYPRKVLNKHWPGVPIYEDIRELTADRLRADGIGRIEVITGGFPCQDLSHAGNQKGFKGERSSLYREMLRLISEIRPKFTIFENVAALITGDSGGWFSEFLNDLAKIGQDAEWHCIPASELGAHHHRDRVWIIAYPGSSGGARGAASETNRHGGYIGRQAAKILQEITNANSQGLEGAKNTRKAEGKGAQGKQFAARFGPGDGIWTTEPNVGRVANGIPRRVDRLKGLGNAVVPQIPELIGRAILENEAI